MISRQLSIITATFMVLGGATGSNAYANDQRWSGIYVGGSIGYGWATGVGNASSCDSIQNIIAYTETYDGTDEVFDNISSPSLCKSIGTDWASVDGSSFVLTDLRENTNSEERTFLRYVERDVASASDENDVSGVNYGGQIGYNGRVTDFLVFGMEADLRGFSASEAKSQQAFEFFQFEEVNEVIEQDDAYSGSVKSTSQLEWMTTIRGRVGGTFGPDSRVLAYVTGGVALAVVSSSMKAEFDGACPCGFGNPNGDDTFLQAGLVAGGGAEFAVTRSVTVGAEYLYTTLYGQQERSVHFHDEYNEQGFDVTQKVGFDDLHMINAKINYHF